MSRIHGVGSLAFSFIACVGCQAAGQTTSTAGQTATSTPAKVNLDNKQSLVVVDAGMPSEVAYSYLKNAAPNYESGTEISQVSEPMLSRQAVLRACGATYARQELAPLLVPLIGWAIDYLVSWGGDALQKDIATYSKSYEVTIPISSKTAPYFYAVASGGGALRHTTLEPNIRCFRYTRVDPSKNTDEVVMDVIGQVSIAENRDYFQVRPLSVYFKSPLVNGRNVTLAMQLSASAVWFDESRGRSEKIFDAAVFSETFSENARANATVKYFFAKAGDKAQLKSVLEAYTKSAPGANDPFESWDDRPRLPLPPVSLSATGEIKTARDERKWIVDGDEVKVNRQLALPQIELSADFSEVGDVPKWLQMLSDVMKKENSSMSKSLTSAADKALGVKSSKSGS